MESVMNPETAVPPILLCGVLSSLTTAVVFGQFAFLIALYAPALWARQVSADRFHISAVLDDEMDRKARQLAA